MNRIIKNKTLDDQELIKLVIIGTIIFVWIFAYTAYSVCKFNEVSSRALVKPNVVMKVIHHGVKSVCPICGFKGLPLCPNCSVEMYWNGYQGTFVCSSCGKGGFPNCPKCAHPMSWIEAV
ncbi:MAG: hypothetical protein HQL29_03485 [Candidatus Omnitrophica bacterium]|nr:hypothetical protein [Candidatus Omnitrophota bacterium]